jgi:hypothetical protein
MNAMASFEISWRAPEYEYREKDISWYWISIILAAIIIAFSVWEKNFLFGFFIVVAEILFIVWGNHTPRTVNFLLNQDHLHIEGGRSYLIKGFENMSVDELDDDWSEIIFLFHAKFRTPLKVLFPTGRLQELRTAMKTVLKEVPYEPTLLDSIEKLLRF